MGLFGSVLRATQWLVHAEGSFLSWAETRGAAEGMSVPAWEKGPGGAAWFSTAQAVGGRGEGPEQQDTTARRSLGQARKQCNPCRRFQLIWPHVRLCWGGTGWRKILPEGVTSAPSPTPAPPILGCHWGTVTNVPVSGVPCNGQGGGASEGQVSLCSNQCPLDAAGAPAATPLGSGLHGPTEGASPNHVFSPPLISMGMTSLKNQ